MSISERLLSACPQGHTWRSHDHSTSSCPVCGGTPVQALSAGEDASLMARMLTHSKTISLIVIGTLAVVVPAVWWVAPAQLPAVITMGVMIVLAGVALVVGQIARMGADARVRDLFAGTAERLAVVYAPVAHPKLQTRMNSLQFLQTAGARSRHFLQRQTEAGEMLVFRHRWTDVTEENHRSRTNVVAVFTGWEPPLPEFRLAPDTDSFVLRWFRKDADQIQLEGSDSMLALSRQYRLQGTDAAAVRAVFTEPVAAWFCDGMQWMLESAGDCLLMTTAPRMWAGSINPGPPDSPAALLEFIEKALEGNLILRGAGEV